MAFSDDLKSFLQDRLIAFDPTIDLSENSPAQMQIVSPIVEKFGEDPFSTDISSFIRDRMIQEFPDLSADNGGMLEDILTKPLQLLLEPFKREIELIRIGASVSNADIMAEEEADALGANWFTDRNQGSFTSGTVRLYFSQPTTVRIGTDKRCSTSDGRSYFPVQNYFISSAQMLFNKQGSFYFLDIIVRAESAGDSFNVGVGEINSIEEVPGAVKVANLTALEGGSPKETNQEYFDRIEDSLTDRSLVTKRGILARTNNLFDGVRALQIVGAGDDGMNRDILTGTGQGFVHMVGKASIYGNWLWTQEITYKDDGPDNSITPQPGDTIRFHLVSPAPPVTNIIEVKIDSILSATDGTFLFLLDSSPFDDGTFQGAFAVLKPGTISISGVPGGIAANITVANDTVHLGGHTDVFVRPNQDLDSQSTLQNISDDTPFMAITDLTVPSSGTNLVRSVSSDFVTKGVTDKDTLVIDTGSGFAGTYRILEIVNATDLRLDSIFVSSTSSNLRARVIKNINVDLVEPRIQKLPFTASPVSDLQTNVGSNIFTFTSLNIQDYGAKEGDTIRIMDGMDAGEFTIIEFGNVAGSVVVNKVATATSGNLSYQVYTKQTGIELPLIRIKSIEVLDSTGQVTGITIPYGDAVDIRPQSTFESAGKDKRTYDKKLIIFPDMPEWALGGLTTDQVGLGSVSNSTDARYTLGLEEADGVIRKVTNHASNQIQTTEINVPPFLWNGKRDKILALTSRTDPDFPVTIPGAHKSSDLADAKIGDAITIHEGPNKGKYIILDQRVLELWGKADQGHRKVAIIQVDPPMKVDPIRAALDLINNISGGPQFTADQLFGFLQYAADWDNGSGFYNTFISTLQTKLASINISMTTDELTAFFDPILRSSYSVGPAAEGDFRLYFLEPVSSEFYFDDDATTFNLATDGSKTFRISPDLEPAQMLPESLTETSPSLWNRNLGVRNPQDTYAYLTSGSSFSTRGIKAGDIIEFYPAINDLPARENMTSSWMCLTQSGSNLITLLLPQSNSIDEIGYGGADNFATIIPGQLLFIDSGPDIGAYTITKVISQDWAANPPAITVQIDQTLTHSTESMPSLSTVTVPPSQLDFTGGLPAFVQGDPMTFPLNLNGDHLKVDVSSDGGLSWSTVEHTFSASDPYNSMSDVLADISGDGVFLAAVKANSNSNSFVLTNPAAGPRTRVRISTSPTAPSGHAKLGLTDGSVGSGIRGAATLPGTKRLYGSTLNQCLVNDWITVYAAKGGTIIDDGEDVSIIGTYKITSVGTDTASAPYWAPYGSFVELDRTDNFPAGDYIEVRWIRHSAPSTEPANTSGGGKEISDQFVRFRLYDSAARKLEVLNVPWATASVHPLLSTSEQQVQLESPGIINTGGGQRNYSHKSPFRVVRPGVFRISSTEMSNNREGALYYVDIPVIGYGPGPEMNVTTDEGFVLDGRKYLDGYSLSVDDENFTYSGQEKVHIILPNSVLPVGATAELDNKLKLAGQNIQLIYNSAPLVDDLQAFFDSPLDRVTAASMLVRHFLPAYVLLDVVYSGGSDEASVASDIINYINNIDPDTAEIRADLIQDIIKRKGASTVNLPITLVALFHGLDRKIRGMRSATSIGIGSTPFFKGTFLQTYFISGPDTSKETERPDGEQVFLKRF